MVFSFNSTRQDSVFTGFSWRWYQALVNDNRLVEGFFLSLNVALLSATLATILATLAAYALVRFGAFRGRALFNAMLSSPLVMPEVIIGLSLLLLFVGMERLLGWPERGTLTIVFHSIVWQYLPRSTKERMREVLHTEGAQAGADNPISWVRMEPAGPVADVRVTTWPGGREQVVALTSYHGADVRQPPADTRET